MSCAPTVANEYYWPIGVPARIIGERRTIIGHQLFFIKVHTGNGKRRSFDHGAFTSSQNNDILQVTKDLYQMGVPAAVKQKIYDLAPPSSQFAF